MPTYDIVEEGVDKTGDTAIDAVLADLVGSNTTITFPPGTYKLNGLTVPSGTDNLELVAPNGARLVPGVSGDGVRWFDVSSNGFVLDGFEFDMRNTALPPSIRMNPDSGNWELKTSHHARESPSGHRRQRRDERFERSQDVLSIVGSGRNARTDSGLLFPRRGV